MLRLTDEIPLDSLQFPFSIFPSVPDLDLIGIIRIFEGGRKKRCKGIILGVGNSGPKWCILKIIIIENDLPSVIIDEQSYIGQERDSFSLLFDKRIIEGCLVDGLTNELGFELGLAVLHWVWVL